MGKEMKNIIVLKNIYPNIFDEVIFVINKDNKLADTKNTNLVYQAKKIVEDYVNSNKIHQYEIYNKSKAITTDNRTNNNNAINIILNIALFLSAALFITILTKIF